MELSPGAVVLKGFASAEAHALLDAIARVSDVAPFRHMQTKGGFRMSVAMTNAGPLGWVSDAAGYRYAPCDPLTQAPWPALPNEFLDIARRASSAAGYADFDPDACLINRYALGARMSLHQDIDEVDFSQPIVSVSLGLRCVFLWGGPTRADRPKRIVLEHGDVVVWGGPSRRFFHGVAPVSRTDADTWSVRYNLTFRKVGQTARKAHLVVASDRCAFGDSAHLRRPP